MLCTDSLVQYNIIIMYVHYTWLVNLRMHSTKFILRTVRNTGSTSSVRAGAVGGVSNDEHRLDAVSCARADSMFPT